MTAPRPRSCSIGPSRCKTAHEPASPVRGYVSRDGTTTAPAPTLGLRWNRGADRRRSRVAAWVEYYRRDYQLAFNYAEEAADRSTEDGLRTSCLAMTGRVLHARGDLAEADERLTAAVVSAPPSVRGFARVWLSGLRMHQGRLDEAHELVEQALVEGAWLGHPFARHHGHLFRFFSLGQRGRIVEALAATTMARTAAEQAGDLGVRFTAAADNAQSWLLRSVGRIEAADELAAAAFEMSSGGGTATSEMHFAAMLDLADGRLLSGDADGAAEELERAEASGTLPRKHGLASPTAVLGAPSPSRIARR